MGHYLATIIVRNLFFIGSDGINIDVIHLPVLSLILCALFKHECHVPIC
jgi:hypothetical protein